MQRICSYITLIEELREKLKSGEVKEEDLNDQHSMKAGSQYW